MPFVIGHESMLGNLASAYLNAKAQSERYEYEHAAQKAQNRTNLYNALGQSLTLAGNNFREDRLRKKAEDRQDRHRAEDRQWAMEDWETRQDRTDETWKERHDITEDDWFERALYSQDLRIDEIGFRDDLARTARQESHDYQMDEIRERGDAYARGRAKDPTPQQLQVRAAYAQVVDEGIDPNTPKGIQRVNKILQDQEIANEARTVRARQAAKEGRPAPVSIEDQLSKIPDFWTYAQGKINPDSGMTVARMQFAADFLRNGGTDGAVNFGDQEALQHLIDAGNDYALKHALVKNGTLRYGANPQKNRHLIREAEQKIALLENNDQIRGSDKQVQIRAIKQDLARQISGNDFYNPDDTGWNIKDWSTNNVMYDPVAGGLWYRDGENMKFTQVNQPHKIADMAQKIYATESANGITIGEAVEMARDAYDMVQQQAEERGIRQGGGDPGSPLDAKKNRVVPRHTSEVAASLFEQYLAGDMTPEQKARMARVFKEAGQELPENFESEINVDSKGLPSDLTDEEILDAIVPEWRTLNWTDETKQQFVDEYRQTMTDQATPAPEEE